MNFIFTEWLHNLGFAVDNTKGETIKPMRKRILLIIILIFFSIGKIFANTIEGYFILKKCDTANGVKEFFLILKKGNKLYRALEYKAGNSSNSKFQVGGKYYLKLEGKENIII